MTSRLFHSIAISVLLLFFNQNIKSQSVDHWESVIYADDFWRYFVGNSEPPSSWISLGFDDTTWKEGRGGIGYGDNDDNTVTEQTISVFIRRKFILSDTADISAAILHIDFDDGFVAYLNGNEIARANLGQAGIRPAYNLTATSSSNEARLPAGGIPAGFLIWKSVLVEYLKPGENVLAIQVHNYELSSSDLSSTTWFSVGMTEPGAYYRPVPEWFGRDPVFTEHKLPLLVLDTRGQVIPNEPKVNASFKVVNKAPAANKVFDKGTDYDGFAGIEIRGQSSKQFPKKSYGIETRDAAGAESTSALLGLPEEEDWVLYAPYSDKSLLRNALTFHLGKHLSNWQPGFRFCELYLNYQYQGVYMIIEKIKRDKNRVDISNLDPDEISGDDLTGGYIFKADKTGDLTSSQYFTTYPATKYDGRGGYRFTYEYPDYDVISNPQKTYLTAWLTNFENVLNGNNYSDQETGYRKYIDVLSFVDFQIIQELTNQVDGYRYSTFFYKKKDSKGGKLFAGPIWDFDLGYGNVDYAPLNLSTSGWLFSNYSSGAHSSGRMHWWKRLMDDPDYRLVFRNRWNELRKGAFSTDSIMNFLDTSVYGLGSSVNRNFQKWPVIGKDIWPNSFVGLTYEEEISFLKSWITERLLWIDKNIGSYGLSSDYGTKRTLVVYPNPASEHINVVSYVTFDDRLAIEVFDLAGRKLIDEIFKPAEPGLQEFTVDLNGLSRGYYILQVRQGERLVGRKNIIIK